MKLEAKDILTVDRGIIAHQVNCKGVAGAGLALAIRNTFPGWYDDYRSKEWRLGDVGFFPVVRGSLYIANLAAQFGVSRVQKMTNEAALEKCLLSLKEFHEVSKLPVYIPYGIGCGLGGADWSNVKEIIERSIPSATICQKPEIKTIAR